jgi:hypothetical protein
LYNGGWPADQINGQGRKKWRGWQQTATRAAQAMQIKQGDEAVGER